jgi:hypothetical protein
MTPNRSNLTRILSTGLVAFSILWAGQLLARSTGIIGVSELPNGCSCHDSSPNANGNVTVDIQGPQTVEPSATESYTITVTGDPAGTTGGFNLTADAGTLIAGANNKLDTGELTHIDRDSRSWTFEWQAPGAEGTANFFAVAQATNGSGTGGDSWNWYGGAQSTPFAIEVVSTVDVGGLSGPVLALAVPRPNPFSGLTRIEFSLAESGDAQLDVFDAAGRRVATLASGSQPAGRQVIVWAGRDSQGSSVASGVYLIRLQAGGVTLTRRVTRVSG